jgi:hypothetical protein
VDHIAYHSYKSDAEYLDRRLGNSWRQLYNGMFYIKLNLPPLQGLAAIFAICVYVACNSLHATLVCVACSQLEKLKLALLDIRQTHVISEQHCGDEIQQSDIHEQPNLSDESFRPMQKQLNNCIRHHQLIQRCGHNK